MLTLTVKKEGVEALLLQTLRTLFKIVECDGETHAADDRQADARPAAPSGTVSIGLAC
jgi:hypothetical protein